MCASRGAWGPRRSREEYRYNSHSRVTKPHSALNRMADFVSAGTPSIEARARASTAVIDTVGVALAGSAEPAARAVRNAIRLAAGQPATNQQPAPSGGCAIWGT